MEGYELNDYRRNDPFCECCDNIPRSRHNYGDKCLYRGQRIVSVDNYMKKLEKDLNEKQG